MTAAKAPAQYLSGFCGARAHERCRRDYRTAVCGCFCHDAPPEPEPVIADPPAPPLADLVVARLLAVRRDWKISDHELRARADELIALVQAGAAS